MKAFKKIAFVALCALTLACSMLLLSSCSLLGGGFDVTFVADGKTYQTVEGKASEPITLPDAPVKNGYVFEGWYLDNGTWQKPFAADAVKEDTSVYAKFSAVSYSIKYEAIGGTHNNPATYTVEDAITLSAASHTGYAFLGWYSDANYTTEVKSISKGSTGDIILYAKYDIDDYIVSYNKVLSVRDNSDNGIADLGIVAKDKLGNSLKATAKVKSGTYKGGNTIVYEITLMDDAGVFATFDTVAIPVYDVNDIEFSYFAKNSTCIKLSSKGEEFDANATDAFGNACEITVEILEGYTLAGGEIVSLQIVATDAAGNRKVSEPIHGIQIYDVPVITYDEELLPVLDNTDLSTLFTAVDSFDVALPFEITPSEALVAGGSVVVTVSATDIMGQTTVEEFTFSVYDSTKLFVKLYVNEALWDIVSIDDAANYTLPLSPLDEAFDTAGWFDASGNRYTDAEGLGLVTVTANTKLYYSIIKSGYIPIFTVEELKAITPDGNYYLFADLDLNNEEWTPVGTEETPYTGEFIGQGHVISNLKITQTAQFVGFFGYVTGAVEGLEIKNVNIATTFDTYCYAGALVGYNDQGTVKSCSASGTIIIAAGYGKVGGLIGYNYQGEIVGCSSACRVSASSVYYCYIGGLIGDSYQGTVADCSASGEIKITPTCDTGYAGGLIGYNNEGTVTKCYASGNVSASATRIGYVGGFVGSNSGTVTKCYATGNVSASINSSINVIIGYTGGLIGRNLYGSVTDCYATGNASVSANARYCSGYAGGLVGYDFMGTLTNCFAIGNVAALSSYESSYGAGIVGYNDGSTVNNCYYNAAQTYTITRGAVTTNEATNEDGIGEQIENLQSEDWIKENLWVEGAEGWDFSSTYPTLLAPVAE